MNLASFRSFFARTIVKKETEEYLNIHQEFRILLNHRKRCVLEFNEVNRDIFTLKDLRRSLTETSTDDNVNKQALLSILHKDKTMQDLSELVHECGLIEKEDVNGTNLELETVFHERAVYQILVHNNEKTSLNFLEKCLNLSGNKDVRKALFLDEIREAKNFADIQKRVLKM